MTVADTAQIAANARRIVNELSGRFPSRNGLNPRVLLDAAEYVEDEFRSLGVEVESQRYHAHGIEVRNIAVIKRGQDSSRPAIVVGAHYDSVIGTPGADDNASGVAGLIELARLFKEFPSHRTIHFVAFPHEEPPYFYSRNMGSRRYAERMKQKGEEVEVMFSLEMIGYAGETTKQVYPFPFLRQAGRYPAYGNYIALVGNLRTLRSVRKAKKVMRQSCSVGVESLSAPGFLPPLFLSDHSSFWHYGYPAIMVTDTAFLRNPNYHASGDTADTLNYGFLAEVVRGMYGVIVRFDEK